MKHLALACSLLACVACVTGARAQEAPSEGGAPTIRFVEFEATITPISATRIVKAIDDAEAAGDAFVLIRLDTPGGLVVSTERIVKRMLSAEVPIVVWVGPAGAKAASGGFFLVIAADVAAMAHGTRTGAASTVMMGGENREDDVLLKKSNEDLAALLRSIADRRHRNAEACERAVFSAKAYEEQVALSEGLIDLVADDREALLAALDGREVTRFDGSTVVLETTGARFVETEYSLKHRFLEMLSSPELVFFLFFVGLAGLYIEFTHPGVVLPGVVGALCLLLVALSTQVLPISATGALLIVLGMILFVLEIKVTSYGMLSITGAACLAIGGWMLVDGPIPELRVPLGVYLPTIVVMIALVLFVMRLVIRTHRSGVSTGPQGMVGQVGAVTHALAPDGKVFIRGEIWNARSESGPIEPDTPIRVVAVKEMRLTVEPVAADGPERSSR